MSCSWSSNIARFIRPLSHREPQCPQRYPHNIIWKRAVVQAVERDLTYGIQGRRFMRIDDLGLGGMVMYDIDEDLEWDAVFGKVGMSVEELLNAVRVQMVYVPLYACTSFVTGQMMNAVLRDAAVCPNAVPHSRGISIPSEAFTKFEYGASINGISDVERSSIYDDSTRTATEYYDLFDDEPSLIFDDGDSVYSLPPPTPVKASMGLPIDDGILEKGKATILQNSDDEDVFMV